MNMSKEIASIEKGQADLKAWIESSAPKHTLAKFAMGLIRVFMMWSIPYVALCAFGVDPTTAARVATAPSVAVAFCMYGVWVALWAITAFQKQRLAELEASLGALKVADSATCKRCGGGMQNPKETP